MTQDAQTEKAKTRARITLLMVFLVCAAPVAGGWLWYHFGTDLRQKNNGDLFQPARPFFSEIDYRVLNETSEQLGIAGTWILMYVATGPCGPDCLKQLDTINRVRLTQGKNIKRVGTFFLTDLDAGQLPTSLTAESYPGLIAGFTAEAKAGILRILASEPGKEANSIGRMYIVDPNGNLVLSYAPDTDAVSIRKDLARLLRASRIG